MKRVIIILLLAQLFPAKTLCAERDTFGRIRHAIDSSLPKGWKVFSVEDDTVPRWSFSQDKCWLIRVVGPNMSGWRYYDDHPLRNGKLIGERRMFNESISIWIGDEDFDAKLSLLNRIKNRLSIVPQEIPKKLFEYKGFKVYAKEDLVVLPENEPLRRDPMPGAYSSDYWDFEAGRSWPTWAEDLKRKLKESFSAQED